MTSRCIYMGTLQIGNDAPQINCFLPRKKKAGTVCSTICGHRKLSAAEINKRENENRLKNGASEVLKGRM